MISIKLNRKNPGGLKGFSKRLEALAGKEVAVGFPRGGSGLGNPHYKNGASILLVAVAFGNITTALYGIIAQVVSAYVTDAVLYGLDTAKVAYIISNFDREISEAIVQRMDRGVTILKGEGAYSGDKKRVLMCAFKQKEIVSLKELIFDVDPNAFIIVCNAHEVTGNGFKTYQKNEI